MTPAKRIETANSTDNDLLSWWKAAGIVGADIGTSVFYSTGVAFPYAGYATPLVIAAVCILMWLFKATYEEGCAISPFNGGAYMSILQTSGRRWAILSGALTIVSYVATAAVSAVAAAYYISGVWGDPAGHPGMVLAISAMAIVFFAFISLFRTKEPAMVIVTITAVHFAFLLLMDFWGLFIVQSQHINFGRIADGIRHVTAINFMQGLATAFLGISGFESAAQIVEQLKQPRWKTLRHVYNAIIILVAVTAPLTSVLCLTLLDPAQVSTYRNNLLSGLALKEGGQAMLCLLVIDAALVLLAAVNTSYLGAIGLCTTMAKQGDLPLIFLRQSSKTQLQGRTWIILSFTLLSLCAALTFASRLDMLGEIYCMAFLCVMISFAFGVILIRKTFPNRAKRSPILSANAIQIGNADVPTHAIAGIAILAVSLVTLCFSAPASALNAVLFLAIILLLMLFYRVGAWEKRIMDLPDLSLGLGRFAGQTTLPELPSYVVCTGGANAARLIKRVVSSLKQSFTSPMEIIIFHAEQEGSSTAASTMFEMLQRVVSQQVAPEFVDEDIVLTVKIIPAALAEGLIILQRGTPYRQVFIGTPEDPARTSAVLDDLRMHLGVPVVILDESEPLPSANNPSLPADSKMEDYLQIAPPEQIQEGNEKQN